MPVRWIHFSFLHCLHVFGGQDAIIFGFLHESVDVIVVGEVILRLECLVKNIQQGIHEITFYGMRPRHKKEGLKKRLE